MDKIFIPCDHRLCDNCGKDVPVNKNYVCRNCFESGITTTYLAELERAYQYAYQYTTNIIRIRKLLEQSPITINNGQSIVNPDGDILFSIDDDRFIINAMFMLSMDDVIKWLLTIH